MEIEYVEFKNKIEVAEANGRYLYELYKEGNILEDRENRHNSKESVFLDLGEETEEGTFVCKIPHKHKQKFIKLNKKVKLDKIKFKNKIKNKFKNKVGDDE